jgi:hypothetical protein
VDECEGAGWGTVSDKIVVVEDKRGELNCRIKEKIRVPAEGTELLKISRSFVLLCGNFAGKNYFLWRPAPRRGL